MPSPVPFPPATGVFPLLNVPPPPLGLNDFDSFGFNTTAQSEGSFC